MTPQFITISDHTINVNQIVRIDWDSWYSRYDKDTDKEIYTKCASIYFNDSGEEGAQNFVKIKFQDQIDALRWFFLDPENGIAFDIVQEHQANQTLQAAQS